MKRIVLHHAFTDSYVIGSQNLVLRQAMARDKLEIQMLRLYLKPTKLEILEMRSSNEF